MSALHGSRVRSAGQSTGQRRTNGGEHEDPLTIHWDRQMEHNTSPASTSHTTTWWIPERGWYFICKRCGRYADTLFPSNSTARNGVRCDNPNSRRRREILATLRGLASNIQQHGSGRIGRRLYRRHRVIFQLRRDMAASVLLLAHPCAGYHAGSVASPTSRALQHHVLCLQVHRHANFAKHGAVRGIWTAQ